MEPITTKDQARIALLLQERGVPGVCTSCNKGVQREILNTYATLLVSHTAGEAFGNMMIPCALLVCPNCGWTSMHSLIGLGLIPHEPQADEN